ncbi:hypothetical protein [Halobacterium hubeiense]|uniref:hypothetical protein n=1 Tax=Halobacterium hubeiense TaxID=1407499 RepID=UPI001179C7E9|nr:hypothetical protein [Halobacterium hubeiense]
MVELFIPAIGLVVAVGLLWKASQSPEQRLWHIIGALGWAVFAVSGFTTGYIQIVVAGISIAIFGVAILVRRKTTHKEPVGV